MCVFEHTSAATGTFAADRAAHPNYWTRLISGFAPRGEWQQGVIYFPYDLAYDSGRGIMALCTIKHTSTATGSILDDKPYWAFLLDMSDVESMTASAVSYSNTASGLPAANVQAAIDYTEAQIKGLDQVNVNQGNAITAIQSVNTTQGNQIAALEGKDTFSEVITAPYFIATNGNCQLGGGATIGYYMDGSNAAIRPPGNGTTYFQSQGGAITYGTIGNGAASFHGTLSAAGNINTGAAVVGGAIHSTGGGMYVSGWGGNGNISVIFLNSAQNHYLYHDEGGNITFSGAPAVHAGNGRLWGNADFGSIPNSVTDGRLPYAGDRGTGSYIWGGYVEPIGHAVLSGFSINLQMESIITVDGFRFRYVQGWRNGWFTFPYA
jgi:hypothetical protein